MILSPNDSVIPACTALCLALVVAAGAGCRRSDDASHATTPAPETRPNVILISLDTVRPDHLGCYGYERPTSPNIDAFAKSATVFTQARSQAPWTLPSHMSLFTSLLPSHCRVEDLNHKLPDGIPMLAELLKASGYHTAALVNNGQMQAHWGFARGFDTWREFEVDTPEGGCRNITDQALRWLAERGAAEDIRPPGAAHPETWRAGVPDRRDPHVAADTSQPFFLFLHYFDAHDPYEAPPQFQEAFGVKLSAGQIHDALWAHRFPDRNIADKDLLDQIVRAYDAELAGLDHELGRLLRDLPENTVVVIFSDHGEAFEEHGWTTHGASLHEEEIRVVLVAGGPGIPAARVAQPTMLLDVAPTILDLCGEKIPAHFEGVSLRDAMAGKDLPPRVSRMETKRLLEGRVLKAGVRPPAKLTYDLHPAEWRQDDPLAPDMEGPSSAEDLAAVRADLEEWLGEEAFWVVQVLLPGRPEISLHVPDGRIAVWIPGQRIEGSDVFRFEDEGRRCTWVNRLAEGGSQYYVQTIPADAAVEITVDGAVESHDFLTPVSNAWRLISAPSARFEAQTSSVGAFDDPAPGLTAEGVYVHFHHASAAQSRPTDRIELDNATMERLRSLGYVQ